MSTTTQAPHVPLAYALRAGTRWTVDDRDGYAALTNDPGRWVGTNIGRRTARITIRVGDGVRDTCATETGAPLAPSVERNLIRVTNTLSQVADSVTAGALAFDVVQHHSGSLLLLDLPLWVPQGHAVPVVNAFTPYRDRLTALESLTRTIDTPGVALCVPSADLPALWRTAYWGDHIVAYDLEGQYRPTVRGRCDAQRLFRVRGGALGARAAASTSAG